LATDARNVSLFSQVVSNCFQFCIYVDHTKQPTGYHRSTKWSI